MRKLLSFAIAVTACLIQPSVAEDREAEAQKREPLLGLAAEKQKARIMSVRDSLEIAPDSHSGNGFFIAQDGSALMNLAAFTDSQAHRFYHGEAELEPPRLLHVHPVYMLAVVKFDHQPEVWIEPRQQAIELRKEWAAVLTFHGGRPALVGPVWGRWKAFEPAARHQALMTQSHILAGQPQGPPVVGSGCPVIDEKGRLCGVFSRIPAKGRTEGIRISPVDAWISSIERARQTKEAISYPLKDENLPMDPMYYHAGFSAAANAKMQGKNGLAMIEAEKLLKEHPDSILLRRMRFDIVLAGINSGQLRDRSKDLLEFAHAMKPGSDAGVVERALYFSYLSAALRNAGDLDKAIESIQNAVTLLPEGVADFDYELSFIHILADRRDEAIASNLKAVKAKPASLIFLNPLSNLLSQAGRWDEEAKVTEDIFEIERLTQSVSR